MPTPPYPELPDDLLQAWSWCEAFGEVLAVIPNAPRPECWEQSPLDGDGEAPGQ